VNDEKESNETPSTKTENLEQSFNPPTKSPQKKQHHNFSEVFAELLIFSQKKYS
jgi:hypothetical protein